MTAHPHRAALLDTLQARVHTGLLDTVQCCEKKYLHSGAGFGILRMLTSTGLCLWGTLNNLDVSERVLFPLSQTGNRPTMATAGVSNWDMGSNARFFNMAH
jgi:hypothetical protein